MYLSDAAQRHRKIKVERMPLDMNLSSHWWCGQGQFGAGVRVYARLQWNVKSLVWKKMETVCSFLALEVWLQRVAKGVPEFQVCFYKMKEYELAYKLRRKNQSRWGYRKQESLLMWGPGWGWGWDPEPLEVHLDWKEDWDKREGCVDAIECVVMESWWYHIYDLYLLW